jgi:uncharacterized membrane protein YphA (DoxX/SURF4 family)
MRSSPWTSYARRGALGRQRPHTRSPGLQRFFSTFPGGWPGAGLLLLRAVAGAAALSHGSAYLANTAESTPASWALAGFAVLSGAGLVAGLLTPAAAAGVSLSTLAIAAASAIPVGASPAAHWQGPWLVAADALALAMLGPGALSIDAWLFGRREIVIADVPRHQPRR